MHNKYQAGYSLFATLISSAIGMMLCGTALHFLYFSVNSYNKIQQKFSRQQTHLRVRQLIGVDISLKGIAVNSCKVGMELCDYLITPQLQDLIDTRQIKSLSDILVIHNTDNTVVYYLRKSALNNTPVSFALYRDDIKHNAVAVAEELQDFNVQIDTDNLQKLVDIKLKFINHYATRFTCRLPLS